MWALNLGQKRRPGAPVAPEAFLLATAVAGVEIGPAVVIAGAGAGAGTVVILRGR
jgi:hypothetical protein